MCFGACAVASSCELRARTSVYHGKTRCISSSCDWQGAGETSLFEVLLRSVITEMQLVWGSNWQARGKHDGLPGSRRARLHSTTAYAYKKGRRRKHPACTLRMESAIFDLYEGRADRLVTFAIGSPCRLSSLSGLFSVVTDQAQSLSARRGTNRGVE